MNTKCPQCNHEFSQAKSKRKASTKPPSEKQLAARERFRQIVAATKQIKAENPTWNVSQCRAEAMSKIKE